MRSKTFRRLVRLVAIHYYFESPHWFDADILVRVCVCVRVRVSVCVYVPMEVERKNIWSRNNCIKDLFWYMAWQQYKIHVMLAKVFDSCNKMGTLTLHVFFSYFSLRKTTFWKGVKLNDKRYLFLFYFTVLICNSTVPGDCESDEYSCRNGRCISDDLLCKGTNPCGDNSDCAHRIAAGVIAGISVGSVALVVIIVSAVVIICRRRRFAYVSCLKCYLRVVNDPVHVAIDSLQN